jgi:hypothetical protein
LLQALPHLVELLGVEKVPAFERALDGLFSLPERMLVHLGKLEIGILVAALQKVVGKRLQQILHLDAEIFLGEFGVGDAPHNGSAL